MAANKWIYNNTPSPGRMQVDADNLNNIYEISHSGSIYSYSSNKTYQIVTSVEDLYNNISGSLSVSPGWSDIMNYSNGATTSDSSHPPAGATQCLFHYSSPPTLIKTRKQATFAANGTFSNTGGNNRGITNFKIYELDFNIIGFSYYKVIGNDNGLIPDLTKSSRGWYYHNQSNTYFWFDKSEYGDDVKDRPNYRYQPVGGDRNDKKPHVGYRLNNCLYKYVPYSSFNFSFVYQNTGNFPLYIYTSQTEPSKIPVNPSDITNGLNVYTPNNSVLLATLTHSSSTYSVNFYGTKGNQYLIFVGGYAGYTTSSTHSAIYIKDIKIDGGYHIGNNREYLMEDFTTYLTTQYGLTGATYAAEVAVGNTINATSSLDNGINLINSKIGNGAFKAGIWENGVWNSGYRVDKNMFEFYDINNYFNYKENKRWRFQIIGPSSSVSNFNIGDNVSISNIIAIDINENRKILKGYYTIINKTENSLIVEFDNNFPLRRIEKDSLYHRIYITKNIWLSGVFLNGYFQGIWNYGLFKGYPLITEMFNSHWIDGIFDGGHFYSESYNIPDFKDTTFQSGKVGLTFSQPHCLTINDVIYIDKDNKNINIQYDGYHKVIDVVNDHQIIIDVDWGSDFVNESGKVKVKLNTGLLQKLNFKSNNLSKITTEESLESNEIFLYNSWLDLIYDDSSASNIGKPQTKSNMVSKKTYSENNLYGWITYDVLESTSFFRDSFSNTLRSYKLGTKYKIYSDFIGDAGSFKDEFTSDSEFMEYGWTYSKQPSGSLTFSRTSNEKLNARTVGHGGILDIQPPSMDILNRSEEEIEKFRYTKIEFDLDSYLNAAPGNSSIYYIYGSYQLRVPYIHFDNLNVINRNGHIQRATYLPIYNNVDHLGSYNKKKIEYFYNKRNLAMSIRGFSSGYPITSNFIINNLHFYEVDMIPFFQYFTDDNINKSIVIPYQAISPFIDYTNPNFNFIDNISIGLDSIIIANSYTPITNNNNININNISITIYDNKFEKK